MGDPASKEESAKKIIRGGFSDERIKDFHDKIYVAIEESAEELQIPYASVIGVLEYIKHSIQHEIMTIDADMIDYT